MPIPESSLIPEGLIFKDRTALEAKISRFIGATAAKIHLIFDFDRTLTVRQPGTNADITSWIIMSEHLSAEGKQTFQDLYLKYRPKEMSNQMTVEDAVDWWSTVLDMFVSERLDLKAVEADFLERANIRPGVKELFELAEQMNIPHPILSAGVREIIDLWSRVYKVPASLTVATELGLDKDGRIIDWNKETLVHTLNKSEAAHEDLTRIRAERPFAIPVGDSIHDKDMAIGDDSVLRIRVYDPRPDEAAQDLESERAKTFEHFDAMIENGTLYPLIELLKKLNEQA